VLDLSTSSDAELAALLAGLGAPAWRATQLRRAAWRPSVSRLDDVVELPAALRSSLESGVRFRAVDAASVVEADGGRTLKLLCRLGDGETVETVAMETPASGSASRRSTICVSSQVGCAVGCPFCATGRLGLRRSCSAAEIVDQVRAAATELARRGLGPVTHVVYMGMGEPLANVDAVLSSLDVLTRCAGVGARRITVSTSGVVPGIDRLADFGLAVTLAISLHASDDALRDRLVPINRAHDIASVTAAGARFAARTGRRLTLEWCLIGGVNDSVEQAQGLRRIARELRAHVNVIPMNHIDGSPWGPPDGLVARRFLAELRGVRTTVRDTRGADSEAACGQLRAALESRRALRADGTLGPQRAVGAGR
jgi:23S rRNA (adenine2503-C2)-methyltransferase